MSDAPSPFYVTGGTLRPDAQSYVERQADRELHAALGRGEFCYVLTSRQMGKSSLMVRTAQKLRAEGAAVAVLDLTAIGQNLSPEQWYGGLLRRLGRQLDPEGDLEDALDDFWQDQERLGPLQRWMAALEQVVLSRFAGPVVLFLDEIDAVRSLPFSTDEFFAGIRECYNRRTADPGFQRLTFCLLGVATPSDLIRDTRMTPFNIGTRIELTDFSATEALALGEGLTREKRTGALLLQRILHWTGGHPYLTQRLCRAVADDPSVQSVGAVDRLCEALFLSHSAREKDDNLLFVRERLLRSEADQAALLDLYAQIRAGKRLKADDTNQLVGILRLSGIARIVEGYLLVRNRIYFRVFDREWVLAHMPDAELKRQKAAYRLGVMRTAAVAAVILISVAGLALFAFTQREQMRRSLYMSETNRAQHLIEDGKLGAAAAILDALRPYWGERDLRGWEWRHLRQQARDQSLATIRIAKGQWGRFKASRDGQRLFVFEDGKAEVHIWDLETRKLIRSLAKSTGDMYQLAVSSDERFIATNDTVSVKVWDASTNRQIEVIPGTSQTFLPDGRTLAIRTPTGVTLWDVKTRRPMAEINSGPKRSKRAFSWLAPIAVSTGGKLMAVAGEDNRISVFNIATRTRVATLSGHTALIMCLSFSPNGEVLASGSADRTLKLWSVEKGRAQSTLRSSGEVQAISFCRSAPLLASGGIDNSIHIWNTVTCREEAILPADQRGTMDLAFLGESLSVASTGGDGTLKVWDLGQVRKAHMLLEGAGLDVGSMAFDPDGIALIVGGNPITLWDMRTNRRKVSLPSGASPLRVMALGPDGETIARGNEDGTVELWNINRRQLTATLFASDGVASAAVEGIGSASFSPDGRTLAVTLWTTVGKQLQLWDIATRKLGSRKSYEKFDMQDAVFSADGRYLATAGNSHVTIWDSVPRRGQLNQRLRIDLRDMPRSFAFSPEGGLLAIGGCAGTLTFCSLQDGRLLATRERHSGQVRSVAFSPDGRTLASGGEDRRVRLWSVDTLEEVTTLWGPGGTVGAVAFSPNGEILAAGGDGPERGGVVKLWRAPSLAGGAR